MVIAEFFIPHGHWYLWKPELVGLHIVSDALTAVAYYSIPLVLVYFVVKRRDVPFNWIFLLFGTFIVSCGTTHIVEIWTLWHPDYWLSGLLKAFTAVISLYTASELISLLPQALATPSAAQFLTSSFMVSVYKGVSISDKGHSRRLIPKTMDTEAFYAELPVLDNFLDITNSRSSKPVPSDWYVVITDIVGSTKAIESGKYKVVNLIGACSIVAVLNVAGKLKIPYIFGGDGAAILIPPSLFVKTKQALLATRHRARTEFDMELRVGAVPVSDVIAANYELKIAKVKVSENYYQAAFAGEGLSYATELIKHPETASLYNYYEDPRFDIKVDFSGLECRWQDIPSKHSETVSLIVKALSEDNEVNNRVYRDVIKKIHSIYGREDTLHPIAKKYLRLAFSYKFLGAETRLRAKTNKFWHKLLYFQKIRLENILGWLLMKFAIKLQDVNWGTYKETVMAATDYKKFDDMLRMVISGNREQREKLSRYLEKNYKNGKLVYGLHTSERVLMTCLVFERNGRQVHFVDGADGGYAVAAKSMKQRLNSKRQSMGVLL